MSEHERASKIRDTIRSGSRTWLIAAAGDELVGCCALIAARDSDLPAQFGEIVMIAVSPSHRRHGHGLALLNAACSEGLHRAWRALVLWVVTCNAEARAFYAHAGFIADGREMIDDHLGFSATVVRYCRTFRDHTAADT